MEKTFLLYLSVHWGDLIEQIKKICHIHFNVITDSILDLSTLISKTKNSIVCSCFGQNIHHSRGKPCVVIMGFFYRSEKKPIKISRKLVFKFVHKDSNVNSYFISSLITFKSSKSGLVCSKKLEKVMILMAFFCNRTRGCKVLPQANIQYVKNGCTRA